MLYFRCIASGPENGRRTGDSDIKERLDRAFDDLGQIRSQPRQDLPESAFSVLFQTVVANFSVNRYESGMTGILIELWEQDHEKAQSSYFFTVDGDVYAALETILSEPSVMAAETIQSLEEWMH